MSNRRSGHISKSTTTVPGRMSFACWTHEQGQQAHHRLRTHRKPDKFRVIGLQ